MLLENSIVIASSHTLSLYETLLFKILNDPLDCSFGNAHSLSHLS
jgi:hypothetical protein